MEKLYEQITITSVLLKVRLTTERNVYPRIRDLKMVLEPGRYHTGSLVTTTPPVWTQTQGLLALLSL